MCRIECVRESVVIRRYGNENRDLGLSDIIEHRKLVLQSKDMKWLDINTLTKYEIGKMIGFSFKRKRKKQYELNNK